MQRLIVYCLLLALLQSCHSTRYASKAEAASRDSSSVSREKVLAVSAKTFSQWLSLSLDSLDVWIYNQPLPGFDAEPNPSGLAPAQIRTESDAPVAAIHLQARSAHLSQSGMSTSRREVDSSAWKVDTVHSESSECAVSSSEATAIGVPPNGNSLLLKIAVAAMSAMAIIAAIVYLKRRFRN